MPIELVRGNLIDADVEALVNTVNTAGVMGKGIALQFKQAFPDNFKAYKKACDRGEIHLGKTFVFHTGTILPPYAIINFPTKRHWKGKSRLVDIEAGLKHLVEVVLKEKFSSIAVPPLGCGYGGLDWQVVRPVIERSLSSLPNVRVLLYEPSGAPVPETMRVATKPPTLTPCLAALLAILDRYFIPGFRLSMLEIQKLAYFLQIAGEPLQLKFVKEKYGPYTKNLHDVLQRMEGHYIRGYGDRSHEPVVVLLPEARTQVEGILNENEPLRERVERVARLIEGFETPYCLELLATIHWLGKENPNVKNDVLEAVRGIGEWSERKRNMFQRDHIQIAWERLRSEGWLN